MLSDDSVRFMGTIGLKIIPGDERLFDGIVSGYMADTQGDIADQESMYQSVKAMIDSGLPPMSVIHRDKIVGQYVNVRRGMAEYDNGVSIPVTIVRGKVKEGHEAYDEIWQQIKNGLVGGLSFSGRAGERIHTPEGPDIIKINEVWAISLVHKPSVPIAKIISIADEAKMDMSACADLGNGTHLLTCPDKIAELESGTPRIIADIPHYTYNHTMSADTDAKPEATPGIDYARISEDLAKSVNTSIGSAFGDDFQASITKGIGDAMTAPLTQINDTMKSVGDVISEMKSVMVTKDDLEKMGDHDKKDMRKADDDEPEKDESKSKDTPEKDESKSEDNKDKKDLEKTEKVAGPDLSPGTAGTAYSGGLGTEMLPGYELNPVDQLFIQAQDEGKSDKEAAEELHQRLLTGDFPGWNSATSLNDDPAAMTKVFGNAARAIVGTGGI